MQVESANNKMSAIDRALAAAKARKAAKEAAGITEETTTVVAKAAVPKAPKEPKVKAERPTDEAKAARNAEREARRAAKAAKEAEDRAAKDARKAERAAKREAKASAKAEKKPAHMKKVERARAKLPVLNSESEKIFSEVVSNFGVAEIDLIAEHLLVHSRAYKTQRATALEALPLGATVKITGGDRRYIGMTGKVVHSQRLRAKIEVPGVSKEVYIYNGEASLVEEQQLAVAV
jgi:hypothetical protein